MQVSMVLVVLVGVLLLQQQQQLEARPNGEAPLTTSESPPVGQLDDPLADQAPASPPSNQDEQLMDDVCVRCYDKVKVAQDQVDAYESLLRKQKKLISRKKAAAEAAAAVATSEQANQRATPKNPRSAVNGSTTVRARTLMLAEPIVVSRLRVARSPATAVEQIRETRAAESKMLNKKDLELERLKREQQRQKEATCRALLEVRDCLDLLSRECIGNLQFHSYEVFSDQYHGRFRCPYPNNPSLKPLPGLLPRSMSDEEGGEQARLPVPRPISSDEEVRQRLQKILPNRQFPARPLGVMLKPTLATNSVPLQQAIVPAAGDQQQAELQQQLKGPYQSFMRDFSHGAAVSRPVRLGAPSALDDQSLNLVNLGKLLLVPSCFAIMVLLAALASLRYRQVEGAEEFGDEESERRANERKFIT